MTPTEVLLSRTAEPRAITDSAGHRYTIRRLTPVDTLRLFKAAGPVLADNQPWLNMAALTFSILTIDDVPVPPPATEAQVEAIIQRIGAAGIAAVADAFSDDEIESEQSPGNSSGTPI